MIKITLKNNMIESIDNPDNERICIHDKDFDIEYIIKN